MIFAPPWTSSRGCCSAGRARRAAWLANRLAVGELHLHQVPQTGRLRAGEKLTHRFDGRIPARLERVRPLVVDLGGLRGGQHQALLLLAGLLARGPPLN